MEFGKVKLLLLSYYLEYDCLFHWDCFSGVVGCFFAE